MAGFLRLLVMFVALTGFFAGGSADAAERRFVLAAPEVLAESGFLKFLLPRFMLKHGVRVTVVGASEAADAALTAQPRDAGHARAALKGGGETFFIELRGDSAHAARFSDWLLSDVGQRTIGAFPGNGQGVYTGAAVAGDAAEEAALTGDAALGETLSFKMCARCHVVGEANRMKSIGSTPSFFVLRTFTDWQTRFATFYERNPHGSFTQIAGVTDPFDPARPSPIEPLVLSLDDLENIRSYVAGLEPADLGAPISH